MIEDLIHLLSADEQFKNTSVVHHTTLCFTPHCASHHIVHHTTLCFTPHCASHLIVQVGGHPVDEQRVVYLLGRLSALVRADTSHFIHCASAHATSSRMADSLKAHLEESLGGCALPTDGFLKSAPLDDYVDVLLTVSIHTLALGTHLRYTHHVLEVHTPCTRGVSWCVSCTEVHIQQLIVVLCSMRQQAPQSSLGSPSELTIGVAAAELAAAVVNAMASHGLAASPRLIKLCTSTLAPVVALIDICSGE